jgi:hypothetical protein
VPSVSGSSGQPATCGLRVVWGRAHPAATQVTGSRRLSPRQAITITALTPMTFGNIRSLGVRSLAVSCMPCGHAPAPMCLDISAISASTALNSRSRRCAASVTPYRSAYMRHSLELRFACELPDKVSQGLLGVAVHLAAHSRVNRPVIDRMTERLEALLDRSLPPFSSRFAASLDRRT